MKSSNLFKLLALLLCAVIALASCGETAQGVQNATPVALSASSGGVSNLGAKLDDAEAPAEAATTWRDFITFYPDKYEVLAELEEIGENMELVDCNDFVMIFRSASVDKNNIVTETYKIYNMILGEFVLTVTNQYTATEEFDNTQDTILQVVATSGAIMVIRYELTPYTDEELESNFRLDEGDVKGTCLFEYYDYAGTLLIKSNGRLDIHVSSGSSYSPNNRLLQIGSTSFVLNWCGELKASYKENEAYFDFDCESGDYGYFLEADGIWTDNCIQVFNKETGDLVLQRLFRDEVEYEAYVLNDGNILVQTVTPVVDPQANYNVVWYGEKANIETFIINVKTGEETAIETEYLFNYVESISDYSEMERFYELMDYGQSVEYSAKVQNFAGGYKIVDKQVDRATPYNLVLNNDGSVAWDGDDLIPQDMLSDETLVYYYAGNLKLVRPNGESYLVNNNAMIVGDFIVYGDRVYDLDQNLVVDLTDSDYSFEGVIGDYVIAQRFDEYDGGYYYRAYYATEELDEEGNAQVVYTSKSVFEGMHNDGEIIEGFDDNYVVTRDTASGIYTLYNAELDPVLRAYGGINVMPIGDVTYAIAYTNRYVMRLYALKPASDAELAD